MEPSLYCILLIGSIIARPGVRCNVGAEKEVTNLFLLLLTPSSENPSTKEHKDTPI